jgi:hypothetical protein
MRRQIITNTTARRTRMAVSKSRGGCSRLRCPAAAVEFWAAFEVDSVRALGAALGNGVGRSASIDSSCSVSCFSNSGASALGGCGSTRSETCASVSETGVGVGIDSDRVCSVLDAGLEEEGGGVGAGSGNISLFDALHVGHTHSLDLWQVITLWYEPEIGTRLTMQLGAFVPMHVLQLTPLPQPADPSAGRSLAVRR